MPAETTASQPLAGWTIVFDLDGTLVESAPDLLQALNHTLATLDLPPVELADIRTMIGHGAKAMITKGLERDGLSVETSEMDRLWTIFIDHYRANISRDSYAFDGVVPAVEQLQHLGAVLAVCTNKTQALCDRLLCELELFDFFAATVGADSVPAKKPDGGHILAAISAAGGDPARAIMVGDSRTDEKAALNAGLPFLFIPFGYETEAADKIHSVGVVHHYSELVSCVLAVVA